MTDVVVIGGGIAGISVAALLSERVDVVLLEQESVLTYHSTGRSAALYFESYGNEQSRPLSRASKPFLLEPPCNLVDGPLLSPRGALYVARREQLGALQAKLDADTAREFERLDENEVVRLQSYIRDGYAAAGLYDSAAMDIDVAGFHQAYVRWFRMNGGQIETSTPVVDLIRGPTSWTIKTKTALIHADVVVNASGAWGDVMAAMAGAHPVGLRPLRRTAFTVRGDLALAHTPLAADIEMAFYFKPDGKQVLCSLAEEELDEPCDARPREIDVALAIDLINEATTLDIRHVRSSWTGHRTFAPDDIPVTGFDPEIETFFWLAGQGGTGIQTAHGAAQMAAGMIIDGTPPPHLLAEGLDTEAMAPDRFRAG